MPAALWLLVPSVVVAIVVGVMKWRGRHHAADAGSVSDQWIAQHRSSEPHDPNR